MPSPTRRNGTFPFLHTHPGPVRYPYRNELFQTEPVCQMVKYARVQGPGTYWSDKICPGFNGVPEKFRVRIERLSFLTF
jgi:hypothetical protein